jgi:reprolysin-like metallo-peptidase family M12B/FIMAH domain-containing protein
MKQRDRRSWTIRRRARLLLALIAGLTLAVVAGAPTAVGSSARSTGGSADSSADARAAQQAKVSKALWDRMAKTPRAVTSGKKAEVRPSDFEAYHLDRAGMRSALSQAPRENARAAATSDLTISLPAPDGGFQRFLLEESPVMAPRLAGAHPGITTYNGVGVDDPAATIRADLTPLGFHASVRGQDGQWYVEPYYHLDQSVYVSYFTRDASNPHQQWVENDVLGSLPSASIAAAAAAAGGPSVATDLRTYRLALLSNPGYATYHGGSQNVTAAKVTLINRVTQIYEEETSIRLVLVGNNDLLNLDTAAQMTEPNGPCGSAACFTTAQSTSCSSSTLGRNRIVIGQLLGASNYDIGHIILGNPGGGVASLGSVGGNSKAQGCTGLTAPTGDYFAVDYVAHEMGHQFGGSHTFNGTQTNCSGGNRSGANSVEPGSGSSIMAYAGICASDNIQPHSDPYWSQRSFQQITEFVTSVRPAINEVETASLRDFDTDGDSFRITFGGNQSEPILRGVNYTTAGIKAAIESMPGWPTGGVATVAAFGGTGALNDFGFQVTFGGTLAATNVGSLGLADFNGADGFVGETAKGGPVDNQGFTVEPTGNSAPVVTAPDQYTIPLRTPFSLTGSATDPDGDAVTYLWEQTDRGGTTGTGLISNVKTNGPLFRVFGTPLLEPPYVETQYNADGENHPTTDPTRVFPDLVQILNNDTNARTGVCPDADVECFSEFLPTSDYVGFAGVNADPLSINFRLTARDGIGGVASADTKLLLAPTAGPFLVTSPNTAVNYSTGIPRTVTWDVAGTDQAPVNASEVRVSLSVDGGVTYPYVLASATPNDGSVSVTLPNVGTTMARIKVEAVGNVFFDLSDEPFRISAVEAIRNQLDAFAASGDITGSQTAKNLRNKLNQAIRFRDDGRLAPYEAQIEQFISQVRDYTPRFVTPAASDKLVNEAQLLLDGLN